MTVTPTAGEGESASLVLRSSTIAGICIFGGRTSA